MRFTRFSLIAAAMVTLPLSAIPAQAGDFPKAPPIQKPEPCECAGLPWVCDQMCSEKPVKCQVKPLGMWDCKPEPEPVPPPCYDGCIEQPTPKY